MEVFLVIALIIAGVYILILRSDREDYKSQARNEKKRVDNICAQERLKYKQLCAEERKKYEGLCAEVAKQKVFYEHCIQEFDTYIKEKCAIYPHLAAVQADLLAYHYDRSAHFLRTKIHPAPVEAQRIDALKKDAQRVYEEKKLLEYKLSYIFTLYPHFQNYFTQNGTAIIGIPSFEQLENGFSQEDHNHSEEIDNLRCEIKRLKAELESLQKFKSIIYPKLEELTKKYSSMFAGYPTIDAFFQQICEKRFHKALVDNISFGEKINFNCRIVSDGKSYQTSLSSCTCQDFTYRHVPCKHMMFIAYNVGVLLLNRERMERNLKIYIEELHSTKPK